MLNETCVQRQNSAGLTPKTLGEFRKRAHEPVSDGGQLVTVLVHLEDGIRHVIHVGLGSQEGS